MGRGHKKTWWTNVFVRPENQIFNLVQVICTCQYDGQSWGFYELYSIDFNRKNHDADSDRGKQRGLNSPHGRRGAICEHFGWTYDYLLHGIPWSVVQRMMIDAPGYDLDDGKETEIQLSEDNSEQIMNYINSMM